MYGSGNICMDAKTMAFPVGETVQEQAVSGTFAPQSPVLFKTATADTTQRVVLANVDATLKAAGSSRNSVIKMNCYLSNFKRDFRAFEEVYHEFFGDHYPARINLEQPALPGGTLIECDFIAAVETEK